MTFSHRHEISPGIFIESAPHKLDLDRVASGCEDFHDYATVLAMHSLATFSLEIEEPVGGRALAVKSWNALWDFSLLSLACLSNCLPLYAISLGKKEIYSIANRNRIILPNSETSTADKKGIAWAKANKESFQLLIPDRRFGRAMKYHNNSPYLHDLDARIMLLWAGIEGLLEVDAELNRRLALYSTLMFDGTKDEKLSYFAMVKKAYGVRSQAVHGQTVSEAKLAEGYRAANIVLIRLLRKCVELGRVPTSTELDSLAAVQTLTE